MISAVVLAAGKSRRMGQPKLNLPWGHTTVLGQITSVLLKAKVHDVIVVTGEVQALGLPDELAALLRFVVNPQAEQYGMISSLQTGLRNLHHATEAVLVVLGDQPQIKIETVLALLERYHQSPTGLLVPSYQNRRGHPWLLGQVYWQKILSLGANSSMRQFLNEYASEINYISIESPTILQDIDTPEDYQLFRP